VPLRRKHDNKVNRFIGISWGCPGLGSEPGWSWLHLFSHFQHFTAEPQRLPVYRHFLKGKKNEKTLTHSGFAQSKIENRASAKHSEWQFCQLFFFCHRPITPACSISYTRRRWRRLLTPCCSWCRWPSADLSPGVGFANLKFRPATFWTQFRTYEHNKYTISWEL
jgi:hypothetical protein